MKKILIIHTRYMNIGGEDIAVDNELQLLDKNYEVRFLSFKNDLSNIIPQLLSFILNSNFQSNKKLKNVLKEFKPDVVYVHNTWFKGSLGLFKILKKNNIKTVIKLHNFRYFCTKTFSARKHLLGDEFCKACGMENDNFLNINKYFKESIIKSLMICRFGKSYFKILKNGNIKIAVLTQFHHDFLQQLGINEEKISLSPNNVEIQNQSYSKNNDNYVVYAGRISAEKGVESLIESFLRSELNGFKLKILGEGPDLRRLKEKYSDKKIIFYGQKSNDEVLQIIKNSKAVVTATRLYEGQPTLLCEASGLGVPSIFPLTGGIHEFFPSNYILGFEQFDYVDLTKKLNMVSDFELMEKVGIENRDYIKHYLNDNEIINNFEKLINNE
tara:strand:+ start:1219 stop:2370 length:1152 start_codon:yes stop_codon:yes gene_type:complete